MTASSKLTGRGITAAVLDTGIFPHPDFGSRIRAFSDFVSYKSYPYDDNGHGTHVCGILAGNGSLGGKAYEGMAPECSLVVAKILDYSGNGKKDSLLQSFRWLLECHKKYDIRIVNISVGTTCSSKSDHRLLIEGVEALWDAGLTVVAAAGNQGPSFGSVTAPGSSRKIITVGCCDMLQKAREASGRGPTQDCVCKPDIIAPGLQIASCIPYTPGKTKPYGKKSGTSMSTPYVSGTIAQLLEKDGYLTNVEIKMHLRETAKDLGYDHNIQGWGLFDRERFLSL